MSEKAIYVHYGSREFIPAYCGVIHNSEVMECKPGSGGLWASREDDAAYGWRQWCMDNDYKKYDDDDCFRFTLRDGAKVLYLTNTDQLADLPMRDEDYHYERIEPKFYMSNMDWERYYRATAQAPIDFEKLMQWGYDAIELMDWLEFKEPLPTWDCNCILVMNPDVVEPIDSIIDA